MIEHTMDGFSMNIEQTNLDKLRSVFPECVSEGKLDIDKLLSLCGEYIDNDFEKYKFEWKGKADCLRLAQKRSTGTLRPCREESVDWDTTQNLYIEGDNLEVLKLLQTAYYRKVKMIYIDPPYNTGNDFVYADDFADPMARYKEVTQQTTKSNPETMGRYHTNWLNMMYPRLRLAANLLRDDGVIFISIDDNEVDNIKKLCNEVFGEENFVAQFIWQKRTSPDARKKISNGHEYIVMYCKTAKKEMATQLDVGFRVFKLDTSNLETWDATPIENEQLDLLYQRMNTMIHRVKSDRSNLDMVYEIMLKLGVPLTYSVKPFTVNNKTIYGVGDDCLLLVCLAENVQPEDVEQMTEYAPAKIIISRDSFADDTAMANAYYILRDHGIELKLV